jgi:thiamine biosynthesis protein ThiS
MKIKINGNLVEIEDNISILNLLGNLKLNSTKVVIELNREIIEPKDYPSIIVKDGDILEIVHFVGGG